MAGVPEEIAFATKPEIALEQLRGALKSGTPPGVVLADAGYGDDTSFRDGITELGILYAVGIRPATTIVGARRCATTAESMERSWHTTDAAAR